MKNFIFFVDIDDTIFNTHTKVLVKDKNNNVTQILNGNNYYEYILKDNEKYDFSNSRCADTFCNTAKPIPHIISKVNRIILKINTNYNYNKSKLVFLTAREKFLEQFKIIDIFKKSGIYISYNNVSIEYAGELIRESGYSLSVESAKKQVMDKLSYNYNRIGLIDDRKLNVMELFKYKNKQIYPLWVNEHKQLINLKR